MIRLSPYHALELIRNKAAVPISKFFDTVSGQETIILQFVNGGSGAFVGLNEAWMKAFENENALDSLKEERI